MSSSEGGSDEPLAEINVTPMVDVLLSLLIIFMVAQPKATNEQIPFNLPKDPVVQQPDDPNASLLVSVDAQGAARIGQESLPAEYEALVENFKNNEKAQTDGRIVVRGEDTTAYGKIVRVMAAAHEAGISQVGIASERI